MHYSSTTHYSEMCVADYTQCSAVFVEKPFQKQKGKEKNEIHFIPYPFDVTLSYYLEIYVIFFSFFLLREKQLSEIDLYSLETTSVLQGERLVVFSFL